MGVDERQGLLCNVRAAHGTRLHSAEQIPVRREQRILRFPLFLCLGSAQHRPAVCPPS